MTLLMLDLGIRLVWSCWYLLLFNILQLFYFIQTMAQQPKDEEGRPHGCWKYNEGDKLQFYQPYSSITENFVHGKKHGIWMVEQGLKVYRGNYVDDKKDGLFIEPYQGSISKGKYQNGKKIGLWALDFENQIEIGEFQGANKKGFWTIYSKQGQFFCKDVQNSILLSGQFHQGERNGGWRTDVYVEAKPGLDWRAHLMSLMEKVSNIEELKEFDSLAFGPKDHYILTDYEKGKIKQKHKGIDIVI